MGFLSLVLGFIGYILVYASVANHGRFATAPWAGLLQDAYDTGTKPSADVTPAPTTPGPPAGTSTA